jgi:hypothetical protein
MAADLALEDVTKQTLRHCRTRLVWALRSSLEVFIESVNVIIAF